MADLRFGMSRLVTLTLVLAMLVGSAVLGSMSHAAPDTSSATAHHQMHDMAHAADEVRSSAGCMQDQHGDCAMTLCCFSQVEQPRAEYARVAMTVRYGRLSARFAVQPAPDRSEKPPKEA